MEQWVNINGLNGNYAVSDLGRFWSANVGIMKTPLTSNGYPHLNAVSDNGESKRVMCHVTVALAFIPNPENKLTVNHKNGIKSDIRAVNLEWNTYPENRLHAIHVLGHKLSEQTYRKKPVIAYKQDSMVVCEFDGIRKAQRELNLQYRSIQNAIQNKRQHKGWYFELV